MNTTAGAISCPSCNAQNAVAAKFCGACGAAMSAAGPTPPPLPPTPPPMPPQSRFGMGGMGGMAGAGFDAQSVAPMGQREAFDHIVRTLPNCNAQVLGQQPPSVVMVEAVDKKLGMNARYRGTITLAPQGPQQTVVQVKLGVDWGSTIPTFGLLVGLAVVTAMISASNIYTMQMAGFNMLLGFLAVAFTAWSFSSQYPRQVANGLLAKLSGGVAPAPSGGFKMPNMNGGGFKMPNIGGGAPFAQQQPPRQAQAAAPQAAAEPSPIEQLERLAKLRDAGVVTAEEFEAKKAEILKRL
jgi:hypothetical protein